MLINKLTIINYMIKKMHYFIIFIITLKTHFILDVLPLFRLDEDKSINRIKNESESE